MAKKDNLNKITNFLALSLCHKIGNLINPNELYSQKYKKEADAYFLRAREINLEENWNLYDKIEIKKELRRKLELELTKKEFLNGQKFEIMDKEIELALEELELNN